MLSPLSVNKMPSKWRRRTLIPIYKNKEDIQKYTNDHGIKLMSHTMKLWERVIEHRLRHEIVFGLFGIEWVMPRTVLDLLIEWLGNFGSA